MKHDHQNTANIIPCSPSFKFYPDSICISSSTIQHFILLFYPCRMFSAYGYITTLCNQDIFRILLSNQGSQLESIASLSLQCGAMKHAANVLCHVVAVM